MIPRAQSHIDGALPKVKKKVVDNVIDNYDDLTYLIVHGKEKENLDYISPNK